MLIFIFFFFFFNDTATTEIYTLSLHDALPISASARRCGSSASSGAGVPWATAQYAQLRVHTSPRIMNVAALCSQHSPMFGQCASSQTVWSLRSRIMCFRARYVGPPGSLTFSQDGFLLG